MNFFRSAKLVLLLGVTFAAATSQLPGVEQSRKRAIILSWDGAPADEIRDLLSQGKLPNLAKLIEGGVFAESVVSVFPSKTAPAHASLWTGAAPRITQISGNQVPRTPKRQFTILESASGYYSSSLAAEPLWMAAARSGYRSVIVQAAQAWPFDRVSSERSKYLVLFEGFAGALGPDGAVSARVARPEIAGTWKNPPPTLVTPREIAFAIGSAILYGLLIDDPSDPANGYDTMIIAQSRDGKEVEATLKPGRPEPGNLNFWSGTIELKGMGGAAVRLRLFDLKQNGNDYLLYFTRPVREKTTRPDLLPQLRKAAGVFVGNGASHLYLQGALGQPLFRGGDGTAERRYLETALLNQRQIIEATEWAIKSLEWELLFTYTTYPDEAEHLWRGFLEPKLSGFRRDLAERLRPFLEEVYRGCDDFLGLLMRARSNDTVIALISDHGMEGVNRAVKINVALQRSGLIALDRKGQVDLSKTKALYPAINNSYVLINTTDRKDGIVSPEERGQVLEQIRAALKQVRDFGREVVIEIWDADIDGPKMGIGGPAGGDVYLDLAPGYDFDPRFGKGDLIVSREPFGTHGFNPLRPSMRTIMAFNGPGVAKGRKLAEIHTLDFAPTLARLLGMATPRDASGRVLTEALAP